jgi:hypothetical protein
MVKYAQKWAYLRSSRNQESFVIKAVHVPIAQEKTNPTLQEAIDQALKRLNSLIEDGGKIIAQYNAGMSGNSPTVVFLVHKPDPQEIGYQEVPVDWS